MTINRFQRAALTLACSTSLLLAACGGGGGSSGSLGGGAYTPVNVSIQAPSAGPSLPVAGSNVQIMGSSSTPNSKLASMVWTVSPPVALTNNTCADAVKNSQAYATNPQNSTGTSLWSCAVGIKGDTSALANVSYALTLTATDDKGASKSASQTVSFAPNPSAIPLNLVVNAGSNFIVSSGSLASLHCDVSGGTPPYAYAWTVSNNGGLNFSLSSYSAADATFTAPTVQANTLVSFTCRGTDSAKASSSAVVSATLTPPAATTDVLVANIAPLGSAAPGSTIVLDGSGSGWLTSKGTPTTGPAPTYAWSSNDALVVISNPSAAKTNATLEGAAPGTPSRTVTFTLTATSGATVVNSSINVVVNATAAIPALVAYAGPNYTAASGSTNALHCSASGGVAPYAYKWSIMSNGGYSYVLSSYSSADATFTAPTVLAATDTTYACDVIDAAGSKTLSSVKITFNPPAASTDVLVANITPVARATPGQTIMLNGTSSGWFTASGTATTGPTPSYAWTSSDAAVVISNPTSAQTNVTIPTAAVGAPTRTVRFTLTATSGAIVSAASINVVIEPTASALIANAGADFTSMSGQANTMHCSADGGLAPYSYQWTTTQNAGYNIALSSFSSADTTFTAPTVSASTVLVFTCKATDAAGKTASSTVSATVRVLSSTDVFVANIVPFPRAAPGQTFLLDGAPSGWFTAKGAPATGPTPSYAWTSNDSNVTISNPTALQTNVTIPTAPVGTPTRTVRFTLTATAGAIVSAASINVVIEPTASALIASAGSDFTSIPGQLNTMQCSATGGLAPYSYQWVVTQNAGYNVALSSYSSAATTFTAPAVSATTLLSFTCRATDAAGQTASNIVSATVSALSSTNILVANIAPVTTGTPGQTMVLNGSGTGWFTSTGASTTGPQILYQWATTDPTVIISNPSAAITNITIPSTMDTGSTIGFILMANSGDASSVVNVNVLVDVNGTLTLTVTPPSMVSVGDVALFFTAVASSSAAPSTFHYRWTQISGPPLTLGGASTAVLGVTPPLAAANTEYVFSVAMGYQPITGFYPGLYFANVVLTITP